MKIFLLAITILLLLNRIKSTPKMLSSKLYFKDLSKALEKQKESVEGKDEDFITVVHGVTVVFVLLFQALIFVYYLLVGSRFSDDTLMVILSGVQIITLFITLKLNLNKNTFSLNIDDHKFHRFYFLFNIILDYVYYPMTIYLLLTV